MKLSMKLILKNFLKERSNKKMRTMLIILTALLLTNCTYRVQFGKACTPNHGEWSYVWLVEKGEVNVARENCHDK